MKRRMLSLLLCFCMAATLLAPTAWASELEELEPPEGGLVGVKIGSSEKTNYYPTFAEAWAAATDPSKDKTVRTVVTLHADVTDTSTDLRTYLDSEVLLELKGHTLTLRKGLGVDQAGDHLIIDGGSGETRGTLIVNGGSGRAAISSDTADGTGTPSSIEISNCIIQTDLDYGVQSAGVALTIENCDITASTNTSGCAAVWTSGATTISGSTLSGGTGLIIGNGAQVTVGASTITGETFGVIVEDGTLGFSGGTITANVNTSNSEGVQIQSGAATIAGEINALTGVSVRNGTAIINEGAALNTSDIGVQVYQGSVTINGGAITNTGDSDAVRVGVENPTEALGPASAEIKGGRITGGMQVQKNGSATISGGEITGKVTVWEGSASVSGGKINSQTDTGVHAYNGALTVAGGEITGPYGIVVYSENTSSAKEITITGGVIIGTETSGISIEGATAEIGGDARITGQHTGVVVSTGKGAAASGGVVVTGGTIEALDSGGSGLSLDPDCTATLSGGTFTGKNHPIYAPRGTNDGASRVLELLAEGYGYYNGKAPIPASALTHGMSDFETVTVAELDATKQIVSMFLWINEVIAEDGQTAGLTLGVDGKDLPEGAEVTVACTSHPNITLTKGSDEYGNTVWTATVPLTPESVIYSFEATYEGDDAHHPATAIQTATLNNLIFEFNPYSLQVDEGGEQTLVLVGKNLPEGGELTVTCTDADVTIEEPVKNADGTWIITVTVPDGDGSYRIEAAYAKGEDFYYTATCPITVGNGGQIQTSMTLTANPTALTGGGEVTLTLNILPEGLAPDVIECTTDRSIQLVRKTANTWTVTLPDETKLYTFHARISSTPTIAGTEKFCEVQVTSSTAPVRSISNVHYNYASGELRWTGADIPTTGLGQYFWVEIYRGPLDPVDNSGRECMETGAGEYQIPVARSGNAYSCVYRPVTLDDGTYKVVVTYRSGGAAECSDGYTFTVPDAAAPGGEAAEPDPTTPPVIPENPFVSTFPTPPITGGIPGTPNTDTAPTTPAPQTPVTTTSTDSLGTVTETTANPDGSSVSVVTRPDGATATVSTSASGQVSVAASLPAAAVSAAQDSGGAVTLPIPAVTAARSTAAAPTVTVSTGSNHPVKVEIPTTDPTPGTVAVLVKADGTEEIIRTSVPTADGVAATLSNGDTVKIVDNSKSFADVSGWAEDAVDFVAARELFTGTSEASFTPNAPMTRAMLATVLARLDGADTSGGATWYEKGVAWAVANGVSDGSNPNGRITREQLAVMLWRYAGSPAASGSLGGFTDAGKVNGYAQEAMRWAVENGVINGLGNGQLAPQGEATRAQVAQMLKNFMENQ